MSRRSRFITLTAITAMAFFGRLPVAHAGCGCQKAPPDLSSVRPNATYAGTNVTLFSPSFQVGQVYAVDFVSGTTSTRATVTGTIISQRDIADGVTKPQLVVAVPSLPLGPTSLKVRLSNLTTPVLVVNDDAFTVVPPPIILPQTLGTGTYPGFRAAIGRDGTFYISLDMSAVSLPRVFRAQAQGYPLAFTSDGVAFDNIQGYLMQLLATADPKGRTKPIPGMFALPAAAPATDSSRIQYSRHEFNSYFLQHIERQPHQVVDGNWHTDGTRHVDHNHLILSIAGVMANGASPAPGATPPFTLVVERYSLFSQGLVGRTAIAMSGTVTTDSYAPGSPSPQPHGDVFTNGKLSMSNSATVNGDASAGSFGLSGSSRITGTRTVVTTPMTFMPINVPAGLTDLGAISVDGTSRTLTGPGSFTVKDLTVKNNGRLLVDNSAGPVTLYVTGTLSLTSGGGIDVSNPDPEGFAIYVVSDKDVNVTGNGSAFNGVVYAPNSKLSVTGSGDFFGSFVANIVSASGSSRIHYDSALKGP